MSWEDDNKWESEWWGNCANTLREELLQFAYSKRTGLQSSYNSRTDFNIDMGGKSVIDLGGGPVSLLLKCQNVKGTVIDPCKFPDWIRARYKAAEIKYFQIKAEDLVLAASDEVWIYNVLQHTVDPEKIIRNAKKAAPVIRLFEYVDAGTSDGHPHELTEAKLNQWLNGKGTVEWINEEGDSALNKHGAIGKCYYGVFDDRNRAI